MGFRKVIRVTCKAPKFGETIRFGRLRLRQLKDLTGELTKRLEDKERINPSSPPLLYHYWRGPIDPQ